MKKASPPRAGLGVFGGTCGGRTHDKRIKSPLLFFNRDPGFDVTGLYFFGSYALGMMARWASGRRHPWWWLLALMAVGGLALMLEFRIRIAIALSTSMLLGVVLLRGSWHWLQHAALAWLGRISYSVFLIHFPVCLVFNAAWHHWFPTQAWLNILGMGLALISSLICGHLFWMLVEDRGSAKVMGVLAPSR